MHEVGIAQGLLRVIEEKAQEHGDGRILTLRLRIGELSGIEPAALRFALKVCSQGTRAEGMTVELTSVPAQVQCRKCSEKWKFVLGCFECPACGSKEIDLSGGDDRDIESFEME